MGAYDRFKGHNFAPVTAVVERGRLRFFFTAIGEDNPTIASRDDSGRMPIPPTYLFCLEMLDADNPLGFVEELGIKVTNILHGGQDFIYHAPVYVGDELHFQGRVAEIYEKKGGKLTFLVQQIAVTNQDAVQVADITRTIVLRSEALAA